MVVVRNEEGVEPMNETQEDLDGEKLLLRVKLDDNWSVQLVRPAFYESNQESLIVYLFFCGIRMCRAVWKECVPHLLGDIVGVLPPRFEQKVIGACRSEYEVLRKGSES